MENQMAKDYKHETDIGFLYSGIAGIDISCE